MIRTAITATAAAAFIAGCAAPADSPTGPSTAPTGRATSSLVMDEQDAAYKIDDSLISNFRPGIWENAGPLPNVGLCSWYRATGLGKQAQILGQGDVHRGQLGRVELKAGDYFSFRGCLPWHAAE